VREAAAPVVLITGGAVRLGRAMVLEMAQRKWRVVFTYRRSRTAAHDLVAQLTGQGLLAEAVAVDLDDAATRQHLLAHIGQRYGRLDALVNNAAVFPRTPIQQLDGAVWAQVLRTNLEAPVFLTLAAADLLRATHGAVVNLLDIHGRYPVRSFLPYCVSKAALEGATRALAVELAPAVRVNGVAPGIALFPAGTAARVRQRQLSRTLMGREGGAEEIARTVRFLIEDTETLTGQVLIVDGGRTVHLKE